MIKRTPMNSILTEEDVIDMRKRAWLGERVDLIFRDYLKVKKSCFYDALNGKTWKRIIEPKPYDKTKLEMKICSFCGERKNIKEMDKYTCKLCTYKKRNLKIKQKRELNPKPRKEKKELKQSNFRRIILCKSISDVVKRLKEKHRENQPMRKLSHRLRKSIRNVLRGGPSKGGFRFLNYKKEDLISHLYKDIFESIKLEEYHIDHIKPICSFDPEKLKDPYSVEFRECWSLENLKLIKAEDNIKK